jgi:hypothetical protein
MPTASQISQAAVFTVGGVDLKDQLTSISMTPTREALEVTTLADATSGRVFVEGLANDETTFTVLGSYSSSEAVQTIFGDLGTSSSIVYEPVSGAPGASAPRYTHSSAFLESFSFGGTVGELVELTVTYRGGKIAQATS